MQAQIAAVLVARVLSIGDGVMLAVKQVRILSDPGP